MITSPFGKKRLMVPRWRSFANTLRSNELASPTVVKATGEFSAEMLKRLAAWRTVPSLVTAAELVETSIVEAQAPEGIKAAKYLLSSNSNAASSVKRQAELLLLRAGEDADISAAAKLGLAGHLSSWRERTRINPSDAIAWVELARCYVIAGKHFRAQRAIQTALGLAPNNRHVLRSAARFFLHLTEFERAHDLLLRSPATRADPWLLSAEIAISRVAERKPRFYKLGLSALAEAQHLPRQLTELAGSVATNELLDGSRRKAARFFRQSVVDPNGNALAQAEWATPAFSNPFVSEQSLRTAEEAYEANAFHLHRIGKLEEVPEACVAWSHEEPFSIRPYEFGSTTANVIGDYKTAVELAMRGLRIRPKAAGLLNSVAFAMANLDDLDAAEKYLENINIDSSEDFVLVAEANRGLIALRRGGEQLDRGREHYQRAVDGFRYRQKPWAAAAARLYFAREAFRAKLPDAEEILKAAKADMKKVATPELLRVLELTEKEIGCHEANSKAAAAAPAAH